MTVAPLLHEAASRLREAGIETARLDAELLLAHALGIDRQALLLRTPPFIPSTVQKLFAGLIERRLRREPIAYLRGIREFWSLPIRVTRDVLIPRPETELLIERALELFPRKDSLHILDLCTGSGCIAAALAAEFPNATLVATDHSSQALEIARSNVSFAADRTTLLLGDLFNTCARGSKFDLIVSNPPYLSADDMLSADPETAYEPRQALDGGAQGLDVIRRILEDAPLFLKAAGWLLLECGSGQTPAIKAYAEELSCYVDIGIYKDLAGTERVVALQAKTSGAQGARIHSARTNG